VQQHCDGFPFCFTHPPPIKPTTATSGPQQATIKLFYWTSEDMGKDRTCVREGFWLSRLQIKCSSVCNRSIFMEVFLFVTPAEETFQLLQLALSLLVCSYIVPVRCYRVNMIFFYIATFVIKKRSRRALVAHHSAECDVIIIKSMFYVK
jgi:hypothetical protein